MREILFRGKIIEPCEYQGQWLEGFYAVENGKPFIAIPKENGLNGFYCDPETVGQYTGIKDKNGLTKIFEGDIVQNVTNGKTAVVQWFSEHNAFMLWCKSKNQVYWLYDNNFSNIEVIGNVYDDVNLLGGNTNG